MDYKYQFDKDKCIYKNKCNKFNSIDCNRNCYHYMETDYLLQTSNIPVERLKDLQLKPEHIDIDAFKQLRDIAKDVVNFTQKGSNLYIYSNNTGNGKTTWAIKILLNYINKVHYNNNFKFRCYFLSVISFLCLTRQSMSFGDDKKQFNEVKQLVQDCDLLVLDDIAATKNSQFEILPLFDVINYRSMHKKSIICTSNITPDNLGNYLDERIKSRLLNGFVIELKGGDFRQ